MGQAHSRLHPRPSLTMSWPATPSPLLRTHLSALESAALTLLELARTLRESLRFGLIGRATSTGQASRATPHYSTSTSALARTEALLGQSTRPEQAFLSMTGSG